MTDFVDESTIVRRNENVKGFVQSKQKIGSGFCENCNQKRQLYRVRAIGSIRRNICTSARSAWIQIHLILLIILQVVVVSLKEIDAYIRNF